MSSVCPSVRPSVTLVICDHIGWKSWKLIARTISPIHSLFVAKRRSTYSQGNIRKFWGDPRWGREKVAFWGTKAAKSLKRVNIDEKLYYGRPIGTQQRSFERYHLRPHTYVVSPCRAYPWTAQIFWVHPIIPGSGKATDFKLCTHNHRVNQNKSPWNILGNVAVSIVRESRKFSGHPYMGRIARSSLR